MEKGHFALADEHIPKFDNPNIHIHKGWFDATVPAFAKTLSEPLAFLHIDSDIYSSAMDVFEAMNDFIAPGTVLLFDEYYMQSAGEVSEGEHQALHDWASRYDRRFEYLWRTDWVQVCIRVTK